MYAIFFDEDHGNLRTEAYSIDARGIEQQHRDLVVLPRSSDICHYQIEGEHFSAER